MFELTRIFGIRFLIWKDMLKHWLFLETIFKRQEATIAVDPLVLQSSLVGLIYEIMNYYLKLFVKLFEKIMSYVYSLEFSLILFTVYQQSPDFIVATIITLMMIKTIFILRELFETQLLWTVKSNRLFHIHSIHIFCIIQRS